MADVEIYFDHSEGISHLTIRTTICAVAKETVGVYPVGDNGHLKCRGLGDEDARRLVEAVNEREGYAAKILK
jgi:hypothetical protein